MRASFPERRAQGELRTCGGSVPDKGRVSATHSRRQAFGLGWTPLGRPEMTDLLQDVILLPADGARQRLAFEVGRQSVGPLCRRNNERETDAGSHF